MVKVSLASGQVHRLATKYGDKKIKKMKQLLTVKIWRQWNERKIDEALKKKKTH